MYVPSARVQGRDATNLPTLGIIGVIVGIAAYLVACQADPASVSPAFNEAFALADVVVLGEDPADSVAEVGVFLERQRGGFIVADALLPRVRAYGEDGVLESAFGRSGDGPWEFRRIRGVAETASGAIVIADPRKAWLTHLTAALTPDTMVSLPNVVPSDVYAFGKGLVLFGRDRAALMRPEFRGQRGLFHRFADGRVHWSAYISRTDDKPYWGNFGGAPKAAVAGDSVFIIEPLLYQGVILNPDGDSVGTIGQPSSSFRKIPEIPRGYFATQQSGPRVSDVLKSFDLVSRVDAVGTEHLVVTVAQPDTTKPSFPFRILHTHVDVYHRQSGTRLLEDVRLPDGAKVLGGGRYLYVLLNAAIPPWRIAKYHLATGRR